MGYCFEISRVIQVALAVEVICNAVLIQKVSGKRGQRGLTGAWDTFNDDELAFTHCDSF